MVDGEEQMNEDKYLEKLHYLIFWITIITFVVCIISMAVGTAYIIMDIADEILPR